MYSCTVSRIIYHEADLSIETRKDKKTKQKKKQLNNSIKI